LFSFALWNQFLASFEYGIKIMGFKLFSEIIAF